MRQDNPVQTVIQERRLLLREGLAQTLSRFEGIAVRATCATADELVPVVESGEVDAAVIELEVSDWDVGELVAAIRAASPDVIVVGLHRGRRSDHVRRAAAVGVDALAAYAGGVKNLVRAVTGDVHAGPSDPGVERRFLPSRDLLTVREREVLAHLARGETTAECASALSVSPKTVDNHKQRIFSKLGVQNQAHAVALAHRIGILGTDDRECRA